MGFGFTFSLTAEVRDQTSDSVYVEVYTEHAVTTSAEVSGKIPLAEGTEFKVGISGSVKEGRKEARKSETANVRSTGKKVSRDYQVETLEREVVRTVHKETKDETRPKTGRGLVFVDEISDILVVDPNEAPGQLAANRKETQTGYRLTSKSGGSQQKRDIWPSYVGTTEFSAVDGFGSVLHDDGERLAREVAKLVAGGAF